MKNKTHKTKRAVAVACSAFVRRLNRHNSTIKDGNGKDIPNDSDGNQSGNNQSNHMNRVFQVDTSGILKLVATLRARSSLGGNICPTAWTFSKCHNLVRRLSSAVNITWTEWSGNESLNLRLELYRLRFLLLIETLAGFKHRTYNSYLRARLRWIIFWRWFFHNLVMYYSNDGD